MNDNQHEVISGSEVSVQEKVRCERCGSDILLKNLKAHHKTKKCLAGGLIIRTGDSAVARVQAGTDALGVPEFISVKPIKKVIAEIREEDGSFQEQVLDDLDDIHEMLEEIMKMLGALMGGELGDIDEGEEDVVPVKSGPEKGKLSKVSRATL